MKLNVRPSTGIISVTITTKDGERTVSTDVKDPALANQILDANNVHSVEMLAKGGALTHKLIQKLTIGGRLNVALAIEEWSQWLKSVAGSDRTAEVQIAYVRKWSRDGRCRTSSVASITERQISYWVNAKDEMKLSSRRVKLAAIRSFFKYLSIKYDMPDVAKLVRIKAKNLTHSQKEPKEMKCFTDSQVWRILDHINDRIYALELEKKEDKENFTPADARRLDAARFWYCAVAIGRYAGLRLTDIASLERDCMEKKGKFIVWTDKRDRRVELDIDENLKEGIACIPKGQSKLCFPVQDATARSKRSKLSVQFMRILEAVGLEGFSFHNLRHTYITDCDLRGIPIQHIAKRVGHTNTKVTQGYIHR